MELMVFVLRKMLCSVGVRGEMGAVPEFPSPCVNVPLSVRSLECTVPGWLYAKRDSSVIN